MEQEQSELFVQKSSGAIYCQSLEGLIDLSSSYIGSVVLLSFYRLLVAEQSKSRNVLVIRGPCVFGTVSNKYTLKREVEAIRTLLLGHCLNSPFRKCIHVTAPVANNVKQILNCSHNYLFFTLFSLWPFLPITFRAKQKFKVQNKHG